MYLFSELNVFVRSLFLFLSSGFILWNDVAFVVVLVYNPWFYRVWLVTCWLRVLIIWFEYAIRVRTCTRAR